jgi:hypothetical protein
VRESMRSAMASWAHHSMPDSSTWSPRGTCQQPQQQQQQQQQQYISG